MYTRSKARQNGSGSHNRPVKVNSLQLAAAKVLAKHNANLFSANGTEVYVKHIPLGRNVVRQLYDEWYNPIIQKRNANRQLAARRISYNNYLRKYGINRNRRANERARILRPNNLKMKYRNLKANSNEYKKILRGYLENMHGKLRKNIRRRDIHPGNPLVLKAIPFTNNIAGMHEMLAPQEYNNYVNKYKKAIMNTKLLHATPNKRKALINLFTNSTINTKAKNINKAMHMYYEREPRKRYL